MTKKDLQEYYWTKRNIEKLENRLLELETIATKQTTRIKNNADARTGSGDYDRLGNIAIEIVELRAKIQEQLEIGYQVLLKIERAIEGLPEREKYLIRERYIERKSWEQICVDMKYEWAQIHRFHSEALKILA